MSKTQGKINGGAIVVLMGVTTRPRLLGTQSGKGLLYNTPCYWFIVKIYWGSVPSVPKRMQAKKSHEHLGSCTHGRNLP